MSSNVSVVFCFDEENTDYSKKSWGDDFYTIRVEPQEIPDIPQKPNQILRLQPELLTEESAPELQSTTGGKCLKPEIEEEQFDPVKIIQKKSNINFEKAVEMGDRNVEGELPKAGNAPSRSNNLEGSRNMSQPVQIKDTTKKESLEFRQRLNSELCGGDATEKEIRLFQMYADPDKDGYMSVNLILQALEERGLHADDPRLKPMMDRLREIASEQDKSSQDVYSLEISKEQFLECVPQCLLLLLRCLRSELAIPDWPEFCEQIKEIYDLVKQNETGKNADYIPQLARVDPNQWGVSVCSVDGQRSHWGDTTEPFCIQSVSKAFNYAVALAEHGPDYVHKFIGQEPSGRAFNAIRLDKKNRPHNPMINAGAIVTSSLIRSDKEIADRFEYTVDQYKRFAGGGFIGFDNAVYQSEKSTADRNFSLAYFMRENHCFPKGTDLVQTLELYFQLCSVLVNTQSASVMAATLANGGVCPLTGDKVIEARACRDVLSLMYSCGMYDYSGQFSFNVGLPAKSGVGGLIITVVPNALGIATWSPRLDECGNSVRGVQFNEELIERFNFHNYDLVIDGSAKKTDPRISRIMVKKELISSFMFAASTGDRGAMRSLLLRGVDANECDYDRRTPLHVAAADGRKGAVEFLLTRGRANPNVKDRWDRTPLDEAVAFKHDECVELIKKHIKL